MINFHRFFYEFLNLTLTFASIENAVLLTFNLSVRAVLIVCNFAFCLPPNCFISATKNGIKKPMITLSPTIHLLLSCRLLVICYVIKTPFETKKSVRFSPSPFGAIPSRTDSLIPLKNLVVILVISKKL